MRRAAHPWDLFYRRHVAPWRGERGLARLRPWLKAPVLELGCGNGKMLRPLVGAGLETVGLDISWHALARLDHPARVLGDAARLPFRDGVFCTVLDIHCGGHLDAGGRHALAEESARVVADGGHVVVERLGPADLRARQGTPVAGEARMRRLADGRTTWFASVADLRGLYGQAGLGAVHADTARRRQRTAEGVFVRESVLAVFRA